MEFVIALAFVVTTILLWRRGAANLQRAGRGWLFRNWAAGSIALSVAIIQTFMLAGEFNAATIFGLLLFAGIILVSFQRFLGIDVPTNKAIDTAPLVSAPAPAMNVDEGLGMAQGEKLDLVRFDYLDANGGFSSRRVKVQMVGKWHFEGIDLDKCEERTFRRDRVLGDITSEMTGEVAEANDWAEGIISGAS